MSEGTGKKIETASVVSPEQKENLLEEFIQAVVKWDALTEGLQLLRVIGDANSIKTLVGFITNDSDDPKIKILEIVTNELLDELDSVEIPPRIEKKLDELKQTIDHLATHIIDDYLNKIQPILMLVYHGFVTFEETDGVSLTPLKREVTLKQDGKLMTKEFIHYDTVVRVPYEESLLTINTIIPVLLEKKLINLMQGAVFSTVDKEGNISETTVVGGDKNIKDIVVKAKKIVNNNEKKHSQYIVSQKDSKKENNKSQNVSDTLVN